MLLEITLRGTEAAPATDLGYLLHKNPFRPEPQVYPLAFGQAHVFWPKVAAELSTASLLLEVDPIGLVRRPAGGEGFALAQYVNDRPYVASSFLAVAIGEVFGTALAGRSKERQALAEGQLPLAARLAAVPCRGGAEFLTRLFAPLGYEVEATRHPLDERFPEWGEGPYHTVELRAEARLRDLLAHLTVLIPVLDGAKHYYVGDDEVDKLLRRGAGWLPAHPERELIAARYLKHRRSLVRDAVARLIEEEAPAADDAPDGATDDSAAPAMDEPVPVEEVRQPGLHRQRLEAVLAELRSSGARRVLDLGCGEGRLLRLLLAEPQLAEIVGLDVSHRSLDLARDRLRLDRLPAARRERIRLLHGALTYRDARLRGFDAAAVVEVIEHLDPWRLDAFARALFGEARPGTVVLTTPNREYNVRWPNLPAGDRRHRDHRFEWTRAEFRAWADGVADRFGYSVRYAAVGPEDAEVGAPSQMAVFTRRDKSLERESIGSGSRQSSESRREEKRGMGLLAYWKSDSYERDIKPYGSDLGEWARARGFTFNSKQRTLRASINEGERLWLVGDRSLPGGGRDFVLRACLVVAEKRINKSSDPGFAYGPYHVRGDYKLSAYFDPDGPDMTNEVLMKLRFRSNMPISSPDKIGNAIQSMRSLTEGDEELLEHWARRLQVVSG